MMFNLWLTTNESFHNELNQINQLIQISERKRKRETSTLCSCPKRISTVPERGNQNLYVFNVQPVTS